ncbi:hypothetical protein Poli38472_000699 [Pythium oligandrum]|uniref:WKF domain-containing protein n=1 Tax=Pythium oligandrum TaxID=41045 RepID=A0A8K1CEA1_PYTOL|nr:hypothetical protein Poli38472_000699 [Pythium oligandrum]|eukprot:TMW60657.1 hypothetical protein Poli38472_000699 [Pythium oligandrum]
MGAAKPSKKQRGKQKKAQKAKATAPVGAGRGAKPVANVKLAPASKNHVKFNEDGEAQPAGGVSVVGKKRGRGAAPAKTTKAASMDEAAEEDQQGGGKSDRSPEMIQSAKYYLEKWKTRNEPTADGEEPWKFKKMKQLWILRWMFEADVIPKSMFSLVLEYLDGIQGIARQRVLESAHEIIDAGTPDKGEEDAEEQDVAARLARRRYKRAMQVAELLS